MHIAPYQHSSLEGRRSQLAGGATVTTGWGGDGHNWLEGRRSQLAGVATVRLATMATVGEQVCRHNNGATTSRKVAEQARN